MLKGLQCIIWQFQIGEAILKFSNVRESFSLVALEIIKHGDQRSVDYLKVNILGE